MNQAMNKLSHKGQNGIEQLANQGPAQVCYAANANHFLHVWQGEAVTSGLKKVTADMKTKNMANRSGNVPAREAPAAQAASGQILCPAHSLSLPPRLGCKGHLTCAGLLREPHNDQPAAI